MANGGNIRQGPQDRDANADAYPKTAGPPRSSPRIGSLVQVQSKGQQQKQTAEDNSDRAPVAPLEDKVRQAPQRPEAEANRNHRQGSRRFHSTAPFGAAVAVPTG